MQNERDRSLLREKINGDLSLVHMYTNRAEGDREVLFYSR